MRRRFGERFRAFKTAAQTRQTSRRLLKIYRTDTERQLLTAPSVAEPPMQLPRLSGCCLFQLSCQVSLEREKSDRQFRDVSHTSTSVQTNEPAGSRWERRKSHRSCKKTRNSLPIVSLSPESAQTPEPGPVPGLPGAWTQSHLLLPLHWAARHTAPQTPSPHGPGVLPGSYCLAAAPSCPAHLKP